MTFEGDLVHRLLSEVQGQVGALPLLQFTLDQLFEQRRGHTLTLEAYHEMGGVKGALTRHAEVTYAALPSEEHRKLARALFLRLLEPGASEQDTTRRRAALSEFTLTDATQTRLLRETIDVFIAARLLTTNEIAGTTTVEVSHEALIREWTRLSGWLLEARQDIPLQQAISRDTAAWEQRGKPKDRLYRGSQFKEARAWARRNTPSGNEVAFLRASAAQRRRFVVNATAIVLLLVLTIGISVRLLQLLRQSTITLTTVTTLNDSGPGSLRQVLDTAPQGSTITFDASLKGTLMLTSGNLNIPNKSLRIRGPGADIISISSGKQGFIIEVLFPTSIIIAGLTFKDSNAKVGSFIYNSGTLTLINSAVSGNVGSPDFGGSMSGSGGISNEQGTLTLINSTVSGNTTSNDGGGIFNDMGSLTLINSVVSGNTTSVDGGGIFNRGRITLTNSTVSGNSAKDGGGVFTQGSNNSPAQADLTFSTIYGNMAPVGGDIAVEDVAYSSNGEIKPAKQISQVKIRNSIVAGDSAHPGPDISGMLTSYGYNLFQNNSGATFDPATSKQHGTDKTLSVNDLSKLFAAPAELRDNGGPTRTYALGPGSPALDQIPLAACHVNGITTDQRGMKRPDDNESACDIGAYEYMD